MVKNATTATATTAACPQGGPMATKLVWVQDDGSLSCGHLQNPATGRLGATPREWLCEVCGAHIDAQIDQELAAAEEEANQRGETWE
jgi:hypothetical protein